MLRVSSRDRLKTKTLEDIAIFVLSANFIGCRLYCNCIFCVVYRA